MPSEGEVLGLVLGLAGLAWIFLGMYNYPPSVFWDTYIPWVGGGLVAFGMLIHTIAKAGRGE